jgi:radical SAM superfamily enzyme YgiQ (UPF0313 family)
LATIARKAGFPVQVDLDAGLTDDAHRLDRADLLCISCVTPAATAAYTLADRARQLGVPVLLGGPHPTALPEEALAHADWVLRGEADRTLPRFLAVLAADGDLASVPSLSYRGDGGLHHNENDLPPVKLDDVPSLDPAVVLGGAKRLFPQGIVGLATSRGSSSRLRVRSWNEGMSSPLRVASPERVAEELNGLRGQARRVYFYDDDFCASPVRTKRLLEHLLIHEVYLPPWLAQVAPHHGGDATLLRLLQRAGCRAVVMTFPPLMTAMSQGELRDHLEAMSQTVRRFRQHDIGVHGLFLLGADGDTATSLRQTAAVARDEEFKSAEFFIATPYPGTDLFRRLKEQDRIITEDWSLYDGHHVVFLPARLSPLQLIDETFDAWNQVYSLSRATRWLVEGRVQRAARSIYSGGQARQWHKENTALLRVS